MGKKTKLYPYQQQMVDRILNCWLKGEMLIVMRPRRFGKNAMMKELNRRKNQILKMVKNDRKDT